MTLQVCIMTPDRVFWNEKAEEIVLPTNTGQMGVLKNHAPLVTALEVGVMLVRTKNEWTSLALMGGFAIVKQNKVTVLVNEAESAETVDPVQAEKTFTETQKKLSQVSGQKEKVEANFAFKRARTRFQLVKKR
uniref:ATP synthase epsilon chain, chloroplastic n=1 Tax=Watanabea reniformis TaxID=191674 RepID=A0A097KK41_9CHLO|nr:CF1 epsilon subunit of ATP synthase [Watanabea reniformis]AIT93550.1 CF1 epsilon subunit of ATP synthase [Watanabea reniformis]